MIFSSRIFPAFIEQNFQNKTMSLRTFSKGAVTNFNTIMKADFSHIKKLRLMIVNNLCSRSHILSLHTFIWSFFCSQDIFVAYSAFIMGKIFLWNLIQIVYSLWFNLEVNFFFTKNSTCKHSELLY